jgi:hypothetical protein
MKSPISIENLQGFAERMCCFHACQHGYEAKIASVRSSFTSQLEMQLARFLLTGAATIRFLSTIRCASEEWNLALTISTADAFRSTVFWHHSMDTAIYQP